MEKKNMKTMKAGAILVIVGITLAMGLSGCLEEKTKTGEVIKYAKFEITPTGNTTTAILNSAKDGFTVAAYANQSAHTIIQTDNSTAWADPQFTFLVEPVMELGMTGKDLAKIYFEVSSPDIKIDTSTDEYYLVTKSGGHRQWVWTGGGNTKYVSGSKQMSLTDNITLTLTVDVNQDSFSRIENTYSPIDVDIKFSNGATWSELYTVKFMLTHVWTG